jgi:hypothetical protein
MLNISLSEIKARITLTPTKPRKFLRGIVRKTVLLALDTVKAYMLSVAKHMRSKM